MSGTHESHTALDHYICPSGALLLETFVFNLLLFLVLHKSLVSSSAYVFFFFLHTCSLSLLGSWRKVQKTMPPSYTSLVSLHNFILYFKYEIKCTFRWVFFPLWVTFPFFFSGVFIQVLRRDLTALEVKRLGLAWLLSYNINSCSTFIARVWATHFLEKFERAYDMNEILFFLNKVPFWKIPLLKIVCPNVLQMS